MIKSRNLVVGYNGHPIQKAIDFEVDRGDVFLILGGSGCGKSTVLKTLIGLIPPVSGSFSIEGSTGAAGTRPDFGVLFQSGALFGSLSLAQNVALPLRTWTTLDDETIDLIVRARLRLVGLEPFANHLPAELSGGMKKRGGIARALALDPELLFLDEPSAGLDPVSSAELDELILTLNHAMGMTMVIVTHELHSIERIGQRCIMLDTDGQGLVAQGDPGELARSSDDPHVRAFFDRKAVAR